MAVLVAEAAQKVAFRLGYPSLREHQLEAVLSFVSGNDVFVVLPTGVWQKPVLCLSTVCVQPAGRVFFFSSAVYCYCRYSFDTCSSNERPSKYMYISRLRLGVRASKMPHL